MRMRWGTLGASLAIAALVAACNTDKVNRSIPPIAGLTGGPDAPDATGNVFMQVQSDAASAEPTSTITVENLTRGTHGSAVAGGEHVVIPLGGDVGDHLRVSLTHPVDGPVSRDFTVSSPVVHDVLEADTLSPTLQLGRAAQVQGEGFCATAGCDLVLLSDGTNNYVIPTTGDAPLPGLLVFVVPTNQGIAATSGYTLRISIAGTHGEVDKYVSAPSAPFAIATPL